MLVLFQHVRQHVLNMYLFSVFLLSVSYFKIRAYFYNNSPCWNNDRVSLTLRYEILCTIILPVEIRIGGLLHYIYGSSCMFILVDHSKCSRCRIRFSLSMVLCHVLSLKVVGVVMNTMIQFQLDWKDDISTTRVDN